MNDPAEINMPPLQDRQVLMVLGKPKLYQIKALKAALQEIIKTTPGLVLVIPEGEIPVFKLDLGETPCVMIAPIRNIRGKTKVIPTMRLCWRTSVQIVHQHDVNYLSKIAVLAVDGASPWGKQVRKFFNKLPPVLYLFNGRTVVNEMTNFPEGESNAA
jgi:hypothetical protein